MTRILRSSRFALPLLLSVAALSLMSYDVRAQNAAPKDAADPEKTQREMDDETYRQLNLFGEVFERVREQYVDKTEDKKLIEYAVNGMLSSLDPHSGYLDEDNFRDMQVQTRGEFGGLGIEVTQENGLVKVVTPIDDTPAFRAGIKSGDYITHLDGKPMVGLTLAESVDMLRGKVGSTIELTLRREGVAEPIKVKLMRDIIKIQSVRSRVEGDVGYIRITNFNDNTDVGLLKAIEDLKKQIGPKIKGYVLDLRNNPGGLLEQAIAVSDSFLEKGEIVSTRGRNEKDTRRDNATAGDLANGLPVVVLINGGTASAAEIVSGALQDHRRAIILGTQSFGKGSVQTVMPMPGHGAMKLTTARYYTPSGRSIQAKGIEPDIMVEQAKIETIENVNTDGEAVKKPEAPKENDKVDETPDENAKDQKTQEDYQLLRGLDLIRGLALYTDGGNVTPAHKDEALAKVNEEKAAEKTPEKPSVKRPIKPKAVEPKVNVVPPPQTPDAAVPASPSMPDMPPVPAPAPELPENQ
jgi:carboxyl-terminal processing protease